MDLENGILRVATDLNSIAEWCCSHSLLINPNTRQHILFGVSDILSRLSNSPACKDLGLTLDSHLSFNDHISTLTSSLLSSLCQISRVKHLFSKVALTLKVNFLIFSRLYYWCTIWSGTTNCNIRKPQLIQNFAAGIITDLRKYDHVTPVLNSLNWLPVEKQFSEIKGRHNDLQMPEPPCAILFLSQNI